MYLEENTTTFGSVATGSRRSPGREHAVSAEQDDPTTDIERTIRAWANAWSRKDVATYLSHYSDQFQPDDSSSRESWRILRRKRLTEPRSIRVDIADLSVENLGSDRARARFRQTYRADHYRDAVDKVLELVRDNNRWQIAREVSR